MCHGVLNLELDYVSGCFQTIATLDIDDSQNLRDGRFVNVFQTSSVCIIATASCVLALPF
jgi:hypothetical protein